MLLAAVYVIGMGFRQEFGGAEGVESLFTFATNPFIGLVLGVLATALIQSSSTVTSIIVALVAGGLPVAIAIPMIMGANVGTTVTNTLVSFGLVNRPGEFRNAFAAATQAIAHQIAIAHFLYNLLGVIVIYSVPWLRLIPTAGAEWIARLGSERKGWAVPYRLSVFFGVPGLPVLFKMWLF